MSQSILLRLMSLAGWLLLAGCQSVESPSASVIMTQQRSQNRMQKFDPFPDTRIGPRIAGLRPPGYRKQISEPARSRQQAKENRVATPTTTKTTQVIPPAK